MQSFQWNFFMYGIVVYYFVLYNWSKRKKHEPLKKDETLKKDDDDKKTCEKSNDDLSSNDWGQFVIIDP